MPRTGGHVAVAGRPPAAQGGVAPGASGNGLPLSAPLPRRRSQVRTRVRRLPGLNGFWGDQYLIAGNDLVIVDQHSRRVAGIIAGVR